MEKIEWDEKFNIGVEVVDKAHAKLFRIMKKLLDISGEPDTNHNTYREGIKYLEAYSMTHFMEEEKYMRSIRYDGYAQHKRIHDNFRDKTLVSLKRDLELSGYSLTAVQRFISILNNWLKEHIMVEDQAIVGKAVVRKNNGTSSQIPLITKAVKKAVMDAFQTEIKLTSPEYKGQNIGNGLYCHQSFDMEGGFQLHLLLGVEESLFLRGVERMPGALTDEVTPDAALRIFDSLVRDLCKLFRVEEDPALNRENLLDKKAFRAEFMKGYPCSLLYGTKSGNFVFCYRSRRAKGQKAESK